jgi:hypothetical protein
MTVYRANRQRHCCARMAAVACHRGTSAFVLLLLIAGVIGAGAFLVNARLRHSANSSAGPVTGGGITQDPGGHPAGKHSVTINPGPPAPKIECGVVAADGTPVTVGCATCHVNRNPDHENRTSGDLKDFHQSIVVAHGNLTCLSCHNESGYDKLKLADGTAVEYPDVMQLCAQCHGPQMTDYLHGAHGGMAGYWDLTKGPRVRNNCVDCHHPHQPAFPSMQPAFKPFDRFLGDHHEGGAHD